MRLLRLLLLAVLLAVTVALDATEPIVGPQFDAVFWSAWDDEGRDSLQVEAKYFNGGGK